MTVGLIGVGRMGQGMLRRWQAADHHVVAYDHDGAAKTVIAAANATFAPSVDDLIVQLPTPRIIWLMIPAGDPVRQMIDKLATHLEPGDTVIDGGNSRYKESQQHALKLAKRDIHFIDAGVSGGISGEHTGYALMVGGEPAHVTAAQELFDALAAPGAFAHVGPAGAGHFVKMVHNAIEYGMMQAIGEGFDLLQNGPFKELEVATIAEMWSHGTIVRSYLMEITAAALKDNPALTDIAAHVDDSGEGRWSVETAVEHAVPFWVNTAALYARFDSRQPNSFAARLIAAMRQRFGGHAIKKYDEKL